MSAYEMRISDWSSDVCSSDLGPLGGEGRVQLKPLLKPVFSVRKDRLGRAFRLAHTAIDAFSGVDEQHVLALVDAVHGANIDAIPIFAAEAGVGDHISQGRNSFLFPFELGRTERRAGSGKYEKITVVA